MQKTLHNCTSRARCKTKTKKNRNTAKIKHLKSYIKIIDKATRFVSNLSFWRWNNVYRRAMDLVKPAKTGQKSLYSANKILQLHCRYK